MISFSIDWLDLAAQGTQESNKREYKLNHHSLFSQWEDSRCVLVNLNMYIWEYGLYYQLFSVYHLCWNLPFWTLFASLRNFIQNHKYLFTYFKNSWCCLLYICLWSLFCITSRELFKKGLFSMIPDICDCKTPQP